MKDIEHLVKKALENHEMPYENGAWEAMAKRLDASPKSPFYKKWWVAASAGLILVSTATYFAFHTTATQHDVVQAKTEMENKQSEIVTAENPTIEIAQTSTKQKQVVSTETQLSMENGSNPEHTTTPTPLRNFKRPTLPKSTITENKPDDLRTDPVIVKDEHIALQLPDQVCLKSDLLISNPYSSKNISVLLPTKEEIIVKPGHKTSISCDERGEIAVYVNNKLEKSVVVIESKAAITIAVDPTLIYENGIPALRFSAPGLESKVSWEAGKTPSEMDHSDFVVHPYTTQDVSVTAYMTDENGCRVEETKAIHIEEKYNLMAMNTFSPNSSDTRNVGFMPYALQERKTPFTLYIYDPKTGRVIFTTSDVNNPWNGYDKTINEVVPQGSIWLWKVILQNPNPGEPHEYKGTIRLL